MEPIKIFVAGDFCPVGRNEQPFVGGDFSNLEEMVAKIQETDLAVANLEAPLTFSDQRIPKTGPNIKAHPETVKALNHLGINLVTLANNHILDFGEKGISDTISKCKQNNILTVGAGNKLDEAAVPQLITLKGKKISILNFAENEFCAAEEHAAGANPINEVKNFNDIRKAKENSDWVIVIVHGGREHYQLPTSRQRERYRFYADCGADLVVGHHPHCFSGSEIYHGTPIFYSLGNFVFDYKKKYQKGMWTEGFAAVFSFDENIQFELLPFFQGREQNPKLELMKGADREKFQQRFDELSDIITDDSLFYQEWEKYLETQKLGYETMVTVQNKYLRAAIAKKLVPDFSFHSREHLLLLLNLLRCETHREITAATLSKKLEHER